MTFNPFRMFFPKKMLGIDIGTSSIKIVEISKWGGGKTLENYGEIKSASLLKEPFRTYERGSYVLSNYFASRAIKAILEEAKIKTRAAIFSIPDFSTFFVSFELPPMAESEISDAVRFNAPQYIPLSISETTLDWRLISGTPGNNRSNLKVLVVAVANQVVQEYQRVAQMAGLELYALEAEALAVARSLVKDNKKIICLIDIGVQSTTVNIVNKGILEKSFSFDFAGNQLTYAISSALDKGYNEAEEIKCKKGLLSKEKNISDILYLLIDPLLVQIKKIISEFSQTEGKEIEDVYLTGGTANLPGLKEYFKEALKKNIEVPNCFSDFLYSPILTESLKDMSPRYSVAVGVAMGGLG
ncbi:pilus assembly protein PilM [Patescibacteria group bacterium]|nr:pilus assembly protein PilM [Patescibacteria group bacterium]MBU4367318.1 pilus assembly protein PilM [Patescibacteria group bacterium]MBU4461655.1 pilus assembly protein PilM [Patescibacteria group bacterium]MCG2699705.1 pilus assembly protein PilM [Candidatus Parcubacteria bacterium]